MTEARLIGNSEDAAPMRVRGLDGVRFLMALLVAISHVGFAPVLPPAPRTIAAGITNNLISGPAAVIVFFVISGFCIHYPYRALRPFPLRAFYVRRNVRIILPALGAAIFGWLVGLHLFALHSSIFWSLVCEEIYYALYPFLARAIRRVGMRTVLAGSFAAAASVVALAPSLHTGDYIDHGRWFTRLLGLPCWLLGCALAARFRAGAPQPARGLLWAARAGVWAASMLCSVLRFHTAVTYPYTLDLFALLVVAWLGLEIAAANGPVRRATIGPLEALGAMSYSLYLVHLQAAQVWERLPLVRHGAVWGVWWAAKIAFIVLLAAAFYRVVERPSHQFARRIKTRFDTARPAVHVGSAA